MQEPTPHPVIYFDGVCNLCNGFVQFVLKRDRKGLFRFAALQSDYAKGQGIAEDTTSAGIPESVLVEWEGALLERSDAVLKVFEGLGGGYRILADLRVIPRPVRDAIYRWVARRRYFFFGKRETCMVPRKEWEGRFLG